MTTYTLALLKPDVISNPVTHRTLLSLIKTTGFFIQHEGMISWSKAEARNFYSEHEGRFFHQRLVEFMSSGEFHALVLGHKTDNAITKWRELLGPTKCYQARAVNRECIRTLYGLTDTRNAVHGSDSVESFRREVKLVFPEYDDIILS